MRLAERMTAHPRLTGYGLSAMSGLLLFLSDFPVRAWPLQAVALIPWLLGLVRLQPRRWTALGSGACLGLCYVVPLSLALQFPLALAAVLVAYLTLLWAVLSLGAAPLLRGAPVLGPLAVGALAVIVEWVDLSVVPIWGTAQVFTRVWSAGPWTIQLVSLTGVTGLVFVVVASQALAARALARPEGQRRAAVALAALLAVAAVTNGALWPAKPLRKVRVAAVGWTHAQQPRGRQSSSRLVFDTMYLPLLRRAVANGAKLVVSPETAFRVEGDRRSAFLARLSQLAREYRVWLVVGYFDGHRRRNQLVTFDDRGTLMGEYSKTHLIYSLEDYVAGEGSLVTTKTPQFVMGGMICQDDNFTDLSRGLGKIGVHLVAVPTNDWRQVRNYHFENAIFRAVESRYAIVRAATNGISAIVTARGEVLARRDHFEQGPGVVMADLPLYEPGSLYSRAGDWLVWLCMVLLGGGLGWQWWRRRRSRPAASGATAKAADPPKKES